jgi:hypothetical protein
MRYNILLKTKGSFIGKYISKNEEGVIKESKNLCQTLFEREQLVPNNILFCDDLFKDNCKMI